MLLNVELSFGSSPESPDDDRGEVSALDGIFELEGKVTLMLNTTLREQTFTIPDSFLALLPDDAATTVEIYDSAPAIDGTRSSEPGVNPSIYISANILGSITLFDTITLSGYISFTASVDINGNAFIRISGAVSTKVEYLGALSGSMDLMFYTDLDGEGAGILGRVQLALADGGAIPGVTINGQFLLEVNSYSSDKTIQSFQTNGEADPAYSGPQPNILATDPETGLIILGDVTISDGLHIILEGELVIGPLIEISGRFEFTLDSSGIDIKAKARMKLLGVGQYDIDGVLRVDQDGLAAYLDVNLSVGFGEDIGLSFDVSATLELSTASHDKDLTKADGSTVTLKPGFKLHLVGTVTFLGFAKPSGSVTITLQQQQFSIEFDVSLHLGPLSVAAKGGAAIFNDGIALLLDVQVDANIFEVIKIKAGGKLQLNTSASARTPCRGSPCPATASSWH